MCLLAVASPSSEMGEGALQAFRIGGGSENHEFESRWWGNRSFGRATGVAFVPTFESGAHGLDLQRQTATGLVQPSLEPEHRLGSDQVLQLVLERLPFPVPFAPNHDGLHGDMGMIVMTMIMIMVMVTLIMIGMIRTIDSGLG